MVVDELVSAMSDRPASWVPLLSGPQSVGLRFWVAARNGTFVDMLRGRLGKDTVYGGSRSVPLQSPAPDFGVCAQSERFTYAAGALFDFGLPGPLDGLTSVTVAYWVRPSLVNGAYWGQGDGSTSSFCETGGTGNAVGVFFRDAGDFRNLFSETVAANLWQHVAWVANSSSVRWYRNGALVTQWLAGLSGAIGAAAATGMGIGGCPAGSGGVNDYITAKWADFRVYNRAMSAAEITQLYEPQTRWALYGVPQDLGWFEVGGAPAGRATRNTHVWPLGMNLGMHHWHNG